ncbi:MAG TPA: PAS domain S-box protein [Actinomycetota bacterium]|nr:PAS domain S-box protein [Actinomycetota bacterium]
MTLQSALIKSSLDAIVVVDAEGRTLVFNSAAEQTFGYSGTFVVGRDLIELLFPAGQREKVRDLILASLSGAGGMVSARLIGMRADRSEIPVEVVLTLAQEEGGELCLMHLRDLSGQSATEAALRDSENRFRQVFADGPVGIVLLAPDRSVISVNDAVLTMLGFAEDELTSLRDITHPEDMAQDESLFERTLSGDISSYRLEKRLYTNSGEILWVNFSASLSRDREGAPLYLLGIMEDISDRVRAEEELRKSLELLRKTDEQRQRLLTRLVDAQEQERKSIAADVHDDSIQIMAATAIRLESITRHITDPDQLQALEKLKATVATSITRLRNLLFELTPTVLDHEGIRAALQQRMEMLREETGIEYRVDDGLIEEPPERVRVTIYRIVQETLANIRKHSRATEVRITLQPLNEGVFVRVKDNGIGFTFSEVEVGQPGHLGLSSVRERAQMSGGWSRVISAPGSGTTVEFWLPEAQGDELKIEVAERLPEVVHIEDSGAR